MKAIAVLLILSAAPALAQTATDCEQDPNSKTIPACTELPAVERSPESQAQNYRSRGRAHMLQKPELAEKDFDAALDILPNDGWSLCWRALVLHNLHKYDLALADTDRIIGLGKNAPACSVHQLRCSILKGLGRLKEAIAACSEEINAAGDLAQYNLYQDRGEAYLLDGQLDQAIGDFNKALSISKTYPDAALGRGKALLAKRDYAAALEDFNRAYKWDDVEWPETLSKRGLAYEGLRRRPEAIADFQRALRLKPDLVEAREGLSRLGAAPLPWWHFW